MIGRNAKPWLMEAARRYPGIRPAGYVPDLYAAVADYPLFVNPMVSGSGIKNKVLEALALGKAVVSTPLGMESIGGAIEGVHYACASTPEAMAAEILDLLRRPERREALGRNARRLIVERHSWDHVGAKLRGLVASLLQ